MNPRIVVCGYTLLRKITVRLYPIFARRQLREKRYISFFPLTPRPTHLHPSTCLVGGMDRRIHLAGDAVTCPTTPDLKDQAARWM